MHISFLLGLNSTVQSPHSASDSYDLELERSSVGIVGKSCSFVVDDSEGELFPNYVPQLELLPW